MIIDITFICFLVAVVLMVAIFLIREYKEGQKRPKTKTVKPNGEITIIMLDSYKYTCITEENKCVITIEFNPSINQP